MGDQVVRFCFNKPSFWPKAIINKFQGNTLFCTQISINTWIDIHLHFSKYAHVHLHPKKSLCTSAENLATLVKALPSQATRTWTAFDVAIDVELR